MSLYPAVILAGGLATRLRPVTETIPKSMVDVAGEPFVAHQMRLLKDRGIDRVVMCLGYLGEQVEAYVGDGSRFGLDVRYSYDGPVLLGTAGAIRRALALVPERFFVIYGDSYLPEDYRAAQHHFDAAGKRGLMTVFENEGQWDSSNVEYSQGRIVVYDKKNKTPRMRHIDYGLGLFARSVFEELGDGPHDLASVYQDLHAHDDLTALEVFQRFYEVGSFTGIEELSAYLGASRSTTDQ